MPKSKFNWLKIIRGKIADKTQILQDMKANIDAVPSELNFFLINILAKCSTNIIPSIKTIPYYTGGINSSTRPT